MSVTLTTAQLHDLTGYKIGCKQREWLRNVLGFDPPMGPDGRPRVTETVVNQAMLARLPSATQAPPASNQPRWTRNGT